jgi:hypothetical protein
MKVKWSQSILVAAACLIVASCGDAPVADQPTADRPPGVDENSWVRISDTAGIVLTEVRVTPATIRLRGIDVETVVPQALQRGTGVLMVKVGAAWMRIDLELPAPRVQPLL